MNAAKTNLDQISMGDYHSKLPIDWKKEILIWKKEVDRRKVLKKYQNRKFRRAQNQKNGEVDSQTQDEDSNPYHHATVASSDAQHNITQHSATQHDRT